MLERVLCLVVGYAFGCFLTADIVARARTGESATEMGTGNPGMANIAAQLGSKWALVTLAGDVGKTAAASGLCYWLIAPDLGTLTVLEAGFGVVLGHNFPFWNKFIGGKGVAVTCAAITFFDPLWGFTSLMAGLFVTLMTKQLCFGAVGLIGCFCIIEGILHGPGEVLLFCLLFFAMMLYCHGAPCWRALHGREPETDLISHLRIRK